MSEDSMKFILYFGIIFFLVIVCYCVIAASQRNKVEKVEKVKKFQDWWNAFVVKLDPKDLAFWKEGTESLSAAAVEAYKTSLAETIYACFKSGGEAFAISVFHDLTQAVKYLETIQINPKENDK